MFCLSVYTENHQPSISCKETTAGRYYYIKLEGNHSQCWDSKIISLPREQIEDIYHQSKGFIVNFRLPSKSSKEETNWKAAIAEPAEKAETKPSEKYIEKQHQVSLSYKQYNFACMCHCACIIDISIKIFVQYLQSLAIKNKRKRKSK